MTTEDYVSFETAKLLKERGFDGDTNCYYIEGSVDKNPYYSPIRQNHNKRITNNEFDIDIDITSSRISAPTLQMAMKWLREKHKLFIGINTVMGSDKNWGYEVFIQKQEIPIPSKMQWDWFNSYEEACETAVKYCLENLI